MTLPADLLARPVEEASRRLLLEHVTEADAAADRLAAAEDPEALHDFRVALRRARSVLRAYSAWLDDALSRKQKHELRDLAQATGAGRDAEVLLAWLATQEATMSARQTSGLTWLVDRLRGRRDAGYRLVYDDVLPRWRVLSARVAERLVVYRVEMRLDRPASGATPLAVSLADLVLVHANDLEARLLAVHGPADVDAAHAARISGKRLRYLVEPIAKSIPAARTLAKNVKVLQDVLGEQHDMHVLAAELGEAIGDSASERARRLHAIAVEGDPDGKRVRAALRHDERPGMLALAQRVQQHSAELYATAAAGFLGTQSVGLRQQADAVADALAQQGHPGMEIERKFLLREAPAAIETAVAKEIWQGYLPGEKLVERVRRVREADGVERYLRTVKLGAGEVRVEVEEETTEAVYERLWPLTRGKRVHKRRYVVAEGALHWEIDVFLDRELVLAEVELRRAGETVELPAWLAPHVVRDVTDEPTYVNAVLAK